MALIQGLETYILNVAKNASEKAIPPKTVFRDIIKKMGWTDSTRTVYKYFLEKYFIPKPPEQHNLIAQLKGFFPGKIYTFMYDPQDKDILDYYDERPVMLSIKSYVCENTGNHIEFGLNLNLLPLEIKTLIINATWNVYTDIINYNIKKIENKQVMQQKPLFTYNYDVIELLDIIWEFTLKSAYRFALRSYIYDRMNFAKEIEYNDWSLVSFIQTKDLCGITYEDLIKEYWGYKLQQSRQLKNGPKRIYNRKKLH